MRLKLKLNVFVAMICLMSMATVCTSTGKLLFADREWHISNYYGHIMDRDTTYRMCLGYNIIPVEQTIISCQDSLMKYPGMDKFISRILAKCRIDSAEILFYAPEMCTMFVKLNKPMGEYRPNAVSYGLNTENPVSVCVNKDDIEKWNRKGDEMYRYTYWDKRKKQLLLADFYDYGDIPVAEISVFQTRTKETDRMTLPYSHFWNFFHYRDIAKIIDDIDFWAVKIERRHRRSLENYKIGKAPKLLGNEND